MDVCRVTRPAPVPTRPGPLGQLLGYLRLDARLHRYVFDLATGTTTETQLDDANTEFPSIDTRAWGARPRYAYTVHVADAETVRFDGLLRYDQVTGERAEYRFGPGRFGSEAPFAPREGSRGGRRRLPGQLRHRRARRALGGRDPRRVRHRRGPGGAGAAAATGAAGFPRHLGARRPAAAQRDVTGRRGGRGVHRAVRSGRVRRPSAGAPSGPAERARPRTWSCAGARGGPRPSRSPSARPRCGRCRSPSPPSG